MPSPRAALLMALLVSSGPSTPPQTSPAAVTTSQYNNERFGSNSNETILTPLNVGVNTFGKLFSLKVDGDVYAEPLYLPQLQVAGKGRHNVLFIATEHDSVYAFDAEAPASPLWRVNFLDEHEGVTTIPAQEVQCPFINPEVGITSTPVIDRKSATIYVLARTKEYGYYEQRLHALDVKTGKERPGSPVRIDASLMGHSTRTGKPERILFDPVTENPRSALLLSNGNVYLTWASSCDAGMYHGWVMAYDSRTLKQRAIFSTSPNAAESGIWQADAGPAADAMGNVFVVTGNGKFDGRQGQDYGDTVLKLALENDKIVVRDFFTPHDEAALSKRDEDLGAGGPIFLPDQKGVHPHLILAGGKDGRLFVIDRDNMGGHDPEKDRVPQIVKLPGKLHAAPAYWNRNVYVFGDDDVLHQLAVHDDGALSSLHAGRREPVNPGATPSVSANGDYDGIVWTLSTRTWQAFREMQAVLHAYDASDVSRELYNSAQNAGRDGARTSVRFTIPMVAAGRVYVGVRGEVDVYGLLH